MQRVIKGHQIVVYGATSTCENRGSMNNVHDKGVYGSGPYFDKPCPRRGTMGPCFVLSLAIV